MPPHENSPASMSRRRRHQDDPLPTASATLHSSVVMDDGGEMDIPARSGKKAKVRVFEGLSDMERRLLRNEQRKLHAALMAEEYDADEGLDQVRLENNKLFDKVRWTRELVLDSDNIEVLASKYVKQVEQSIQVARYDASRLVHALRRKCSKADGSFDWKMLGTEAGICFNAIPANCAFAAGVWDNPVEGLQRRQRAPRTAKIVDTSKEQEPEKVVADPKDATSSRALSVAEANVKRLEKKVQQQYKEALQQYQASGGDPRTAAVDGIECLLDRQSFTKTVENFFYFSFLIKEGKASIKVDHEAEARSKVALRIPIQREGMLAEPTQGVCTFTMRDWRRLQTLYTDE